MKRVIDTENPIPVAVAVNRVEVIDHSEGGKGRDYVKWEKKLSVSLSFQDGGKTLKVFIAD